MLTFLWLLFQFLLGAIFGSFANVCIFRMPADQSIRFPGSHCPHCQTPVRILDNIPILSFFLLGRQCRYCRAPISWQYPAVEVIMAALFLFIGLRWAHEPLRIVLCDVLGFYLLTLSVIDYDHRIIPDELSLSLLGLGWLTSPWNPYLGAAWGPRLVQSLTAGLGGGTMMWMLAWAGEKVFKKEALGGGDIKLIAAIGALLGWDGILAALLGGSFTGSMAAVVLLVLRKKRWGEVLPFGPFLSFGAFIAAIMPSWQSTLTRFIDGALAGIFP
jgi:leader peptidase (prepilin peptidase) / N-methyltransferase